MRQENFNRQFQETLVNFKHNMNILEIQSIKVKKMSEDRGQIHSSLHDLERVLSRIEENTTSSNKCLDFLL